MKQHEVSMALEMLNLATSLIAAAPEVVATIRTGSDALKRAHDQGRELSSADWDALNAAEDALRKELKQAAAPQ